MTDPEVLDDIRKGCKAARPERFTDREHCCECAEHDDLLASRDLDSLTIEDVGNPGWDPICFVTDHAFFYYFPALARIALEEPRYGYGWYFEQLLFHLTYEGRANRRLLMAGPGQRDAVLKLLRHVRDTRPMLVQEHGCKIELEQALTLWMQ
jgi:hypothetical protein